MTVGIVKDPLYLEHTVDDFHPENPGRLRHIYSMLPSIEGLHYIEPRMSTHDEIGFIHDMPYIERIAATRGHSVCLDPDTSTSPRSYEAALLAAGGCLSLADSIVSGDVSSGFALVRPPGHHAERSRAMGFCIFNNIAVAARYLQQEKGIERVLIVDFDLHHGNGTQHAFYSDPSVLYFSTHQFPYYPGTGWYEEVGADEGRGYTVNVPMGFSMNDEDHLYTFRELLVPIAHLFKPEVVLVSAGFDSYCDDPLGGMLVTEEGFSAMTAVICEIAARSCSSRALFVLEGGYDPAGLARSVKAVITTMQGQPAYEYREQRNPCRGIVSLVNDVKRTLSPYWGTF